MMKGANVHDIVLIYLQGWEEGRFRPFRKGLDKKKKKKIKKGKKKVISVITSVLFLFRVVAYKGCCI